MRLLAETPDTSLWRGDIIRLAHDPERGLNSGSVDLMVFDPLAGDAGMGVIYVSGYQAGNVASVFPRESCAEGRRSLETSWLLANWNTWFCFYYERPAGEPLISIPIEGTLLLEWHEREIVIKT